MKPKLNSYLILIFNLVKSKVNLKYIYLSWFAIVDIEQN